jgi:hypothetical protein
MMFRRLSWFLFGTLRGRLVVGVAMSAISVESCPRSRGICRPLTLSVACFGYKRCMDLQLEESCLWFSFTLSACCWPAFVIGKIWLWAMLSGHKRHPGPIDVA